MNEDLRKFLISTMFGADLAEELFGHCSISIEKKDGGLDTKIDGSGAQVMELLDTLAGKVVLEASCGSKKCADELIKSHIENLREYVENYMEDKKG